MTPLQENEAVVNKANLTSDWNFSYIRSSLTIDQGISKESLGFHLI